MEKKNFFFFFTLLQKWNVWSNTFDAPKIIIMKASVVTLYRLVACSVWSYFHQRLHCIRQTIDLWEINNLVRKVWKYYNKKSHKIEIKKQKTPYIKRKKTSQNQILLSVSFKNSTAVRIFVIYDITSGTSIFCINGELDYWGFSSTVFCTFFSFSYGCIHCKNMKHTLPYSKGTSTSDANSQLLVLPVSA